MSKERIKEILGNYTDPFYYAETDKILSLWAADGILSSPGIPPIIGKNAIRDYYNSQFNNIQNICRWVVYFSPEYFSVDDSKVIVNGTLKDASETFAGGSLEENIVISGKFMMLFVKDSDSNWKIKQFNWNYDKGENVLIEEKSILKKNKIH